VSTRTKDIEDAAKEVLAHGWTEVDGKRYRKFRCPCGAHMKTIKKTPSDPNYVRNLLAWFRRQDCWKDGEE
jgi:hypothetical protein